MKAKKRVSISAYSCTSGSSLSADHLWQQVSEGATSAQSLNSNILECFPEAVRPSSLKAHLWESSGTRTQKQKLLDNLIISWRGAREKLSLKAQGRIERGRSLGVILASTKGFIDDFIWQKDSPHFITDSLTPLLELFLETEKLRPAKKICISNACASGISSVFLANKWLENDEITDVLIIACDAVGPFVLRGFGTLKIFATEATRPFSNERDGFFLGEASAAIVFSNQEMGSFSIDGVGIDAEGYAVTRPSQSGASLVRASRKIPNLESIDFVLAHGTATKMNDLAEDAAYETLFLNQTRKPIITASKWSIGHTLGASGTMDLILACECLKRQKIFSIALSAQGDPDFKNQYLTSGASFQPIVKLKRAMISSLGFGGLHAAVGVSYELSSSNLL